MNGRYFLDTNTIIQFLKGNREIFKIINNSNFLACSVISELEYLSFNNLQDDDIALFKEFMTRIKVYDLLHEDNSLKNSILSIRKSKKVKLPDAIILATSSNNDCTLITSDKHLLSFKEIYKTINFTPIQ